MSLINTILNEAWCIRPQSLETIISIANRENDLEAVEFKMGRQLDNTRTVTRRGSTAIIPVVGSIFRYANLMTKVSGATSLSVLAQDFQEAEENEEINTIILQIDTAGGQASGISEFADRVRASNKKVIAYVDNQCASAGYWIASACDEIVANKTSLIGSIGVVFALQDNSKQLENNGLKNIEIVSRVSPKKRPNISSQEGQSQIQEWADSLADLFIEAVANFRGVTTETVLEKFGQGNMFIASKALEVGMIDRLGDFESLILEVEQKSVNSTSQINFIGESMSLTLDEFKSGNPELYSQIVADAREKGAVAERERIKEIDSINASGFEDVVASLKFDGKSRASDVKAVLFDRREAQFEQMQQNLRDDGSQLSGLVGEIGADASESILDENEPTAESILADAVKRSNGEK